MDVKLSQKVAHTLSGFTSLSPEEKRQFYWALQNPNRAGLVVPPPETVDPWQVFTLHDAYQERPPVEYTAGMLFAKPSLNIVYGSPGTMKSMMLADLAVCVAAGIEWLPPASWINGNLARGIPTRQCPVMWLDFDNGRRRTHDRFAALGRARDLPPDIPLYYYSMPSPWLDGSNKASVSELILRMLDRGVGFLIVDNLGVVSGDADENSGEMAHVMSEFRQLGEETLAGVVMVHHQRKSTGINSRAGDTLRGHSSIEASLDLALLVQREELSDLISVKATKVRGDDVLPFSAVFTFEHDRYGELYKARFFGVAAEDNRSGAAIEREILQALDGASLNKTELTRAVKETLSDVGINRIRDMIDRLAASGKLYVSTGKNNTEKVYSRA